MERSRKYSFVPLAKGIYELLASRLEPGLFPDPPPSTARDRPAHSKRSKKSPRRKPMSISLAREESKHSLASEDYKRMVSRMLTPSPDLPSQEEGFAGHRGRQEFWQMWKSNRVLKDDDDSHDPRIMYLKACRDQSLLPKAIHMIRDTPPSQISLPGVGLIPEFVTAITKSIDGMKYPVEILDLSSNRLMNSSGIKLVQSLHRHTSTLQVLNFSYNKFTSEWGVALKDLLKECKELREIDISGISFGDTLMAEIVAVLGKNISLVTLKLSKCGICKSSLATKVCKSLAKLIKTHTSLEELDLSWNSFRGEYAERVIRALVYNNTLTKLNFSYNMLGSGMNPAVNSFSEIFVKNNTLEELDISHNMIPPNSAIVLSYYLKKNSTITALQIDGNPIGDKGLNSLLEALEEKNVNIKADQSFMEMSSSMASIEVVPDKPAVFDLTKDFDRVKLSEFLDTLEDPEMIKDIRINERKFELPPTPKQGIWELPKEGNLSFTLSNRESSPQPNQSNSVLSERALDKYLQLLGEENPGMVNMIKTISKSKALWSSQAHELVDLFMRGSWEQEQVIYDILPKLIDTHNFPNLLLSVKDSVARSIVKKLGNVLVFSEHAPSGHYKIDLSDLSHSNLFQSLRKISERYAIENAEKVDKGMYGSRSLFRNEKLNGQRLEVINSWKPPKSGNLEFDFAVFDELDHPETSISMLSSLATLLKSSKCSPETTLKAFKLSLPYLVFTTNSLKTFVSEVSDNSYWIEEALAIGLPRCLDLQNLDFVKNYLMDIDKGDLIDSLCGRLGLLHIFNPLRPEGLYRLDLGLYEERKMCEIILTICKEEGYQETSFFSYNSEKIDITPDFIQRLPSSGRFEIVFFSSNPDYELREKLADQLNIA